MIFDCTLHYTYVTSGLLVGRAETWNILVIELYDDVIVSGFEGRVVHSARAVVVVDTFHLRLTGAYKSISYYITR